MVDLETRPEHVPNELKEQGVSVASVSVWVSVVWVSVSVSVEEP